MADLSAQGLTTNILIFVASGAVVGVAGAGLARYADEITRRSNLGEALMGIFLLAGVTSLPEIATSFTAARSGDAPLAVNNLLGSVAMQVAVLAIGDMVYGRHALTSVVPDSTVILQGALNTVLLSLVAVAIIVGDTPLLGAGVWTWALVVSAVYSFMKLNEADGRKPWVADIDDEVVTGGRPQADPEASNLTLALKVTASAIAILTAGFLVARSGEAIANQTALGSSFMGVVFLALATSLPEVSTVFSALRRGLQTMAISDILGTNILNVLLLFGVDAVASGGPVIDRVGNFAAIAALLGVVLTGVFLVGLAERRDRTVLRMGTDSLAVLVLYAGGVTLLYTMKDS